MDALRKSYVLGVPSSLYIEGSRPCRLSHVLYRAVKQVESHCETERDFDPMLIRDFQGQHHQTLSLLALLNDVPDGEPRLQANWMQSMDGRSDIASQGAIIPHLAHFCRRPFTWKMTFAE